MRILIIACLALSACIPSLGPNQKIPNVRGNKRVLFIGKNAKNPNAAKLWTDYVLSARGQKLIGSDVELFAIRNDVDAEYTAASLNKQLGNNVKPIPVSSEIVAYLDPKKRLDFLNSWKTTLASAGK